MSDLDTATSNTILLGQVGSGLHGVTVAGHDDRDEMGIFVEPPEYILGLKRLDHVVTRTAAEGMRSGPGDLDLVLYSLRKWMRLALAGNPTVLMLAFLPQAEVVSSTELGSWLRSEHLHQRLLSKQAGQRFLGYLDGQRDRMLGVRGKATNRPELVAVYGYDTKFAYHAMRLAMQGTELMTTGKVTLPMREYERDLLLDVREGRFGGLGTAVEFLGHLREELVNAIAESALPDEPDREWMDAWLVNAHYWHWKQTGQMP